jgi:hypothetical protein
MGSGGFRAFRVSLRQVGLSIYRWGGEFTWQTTGPESHAASEPLPLPTTIAGALLGPDPKGRLHPPLEEAPGGLERLVGCKTYLRGPYYPRVGGGAAVHVYPGMLALLDTAGMLEWVSRKKLLLRPGYATARGTALGRSSKTAVQGMLYSESFIDPLELEATGIEAAVSVDLVVEGGCEPEPLGSRLRRLGGEMRPSTLRIEGEPILYRIATGNPNPRYALVATPLLLENPEDARRLAEGEPVQVGDCLLAAPSVEEVEKAIRTREDVEPKAVKAGIKSLRVKIGLLSPGAYQDGLPRRPYPAILPGSLLKAERCNTHTLLQGLGKHSAIGFGTLVPLKTP